MVESRQAGASCRRNGCGSRRNPPARRTVRVAGSTNTYWPCNPIAEKDPPPSVHHCSPYPPRGPSTGPEDGPRGGYGLQWWTLGGGSFSAIGLQGQYVFVDPATRTVLRAGGLRRLPHPFRRHDAPACRDSTIEHHL